MRDLAHRLEGFAGSAAALATALLGLTIAPGARADEQLWAFARGAETLPKGHGRGLPVRDAAHRQEGSGNYYGYDFDTEIEYGFTDRSRPASSW